MEKYTIPVLRGQFLLDIKISNWRQLYFYNDRCTVGQESRISCRDHLCIVNGLFNGVYSPKKIARNLYLSLEDVTYFGLSTENSRYSLLNKEWQDQLTYPDKYSHIIFDCKSVSPKITYVEYMRTSEFKDISLQRFKKFFSQCYYELYKLEDTFKSIERFFLDLYNVKSFIYMAEFYISWKKYQNHITRPIQNIHPETQFIQNVNALINTIPYENKTFEYSNRFSY